MGIYLVILICLLAGYFSINLLIHTLPQVEAGAISNVKSTTVQRIKDNIPPSYTKIEDGVQTLHRNFVVRGTCMENQQIQNGSIVDVTMFNKQQRCEINKHIKEGDIILIFINDQNFRGYKLRIVKHVMEDSVQTYYYIGDELRSYSKPHLFKDIVGIVHKDKAGCNSTPL